MRVALAAVAVIPAGPGSAYEDTAVTPCSALKAGFRIEVAVAAMEHCREVRSQTDVAVVDRRGPAQPFVRDRLASTQAIETASRKARTAVSFRTETSEANTVAQLGTDQFRTRLIGRAKPLGGGVMIECGGAMRGAVGLGSAPGLNFNDDFAGARIASIEDSLGI